jgi:hypothetical protein
MTRTEQSGVVVERIGVGRETVGIAKVVERPHGGSSESVTVPWRVTFSYACSRSMHSNANEGRKKKKKAKPSEMELKAT